MDEHLFEAREELKRLEHTIYVTLKYTRTVDVIKSTVIRLIGVFDTIVTALLENAKEKKIITDIPKSPSLRSALIAKLHSEDKNLLKFIAFYTFLRDVLNAKHTRREEYRRHVTLIANFEDKTAEIDIDNLETCEIVAHQFFDYAKELIKGKAEEEM